MVLPLPKLVPTVSPCYLKRRRGGPTAFLRNVGSFHVLYERQKELLAWAAQAGAKAAGPVYFIYHDDSAVTPEEELRGDVCLPLQELVPGSGAVTTRVVEEALCACVLYEGVNTRGPSLWGVVYEWLEKNGWTEAAAPEKHQLLHDEDLGDMDDAFELCVPVKRA
ncbi:MAG TPA: GyrI-like domain-containing protein [Candidatus Thermoplasmatota archaeon]|nr:GyrI-like domain-containing protein [Candidatus Thermoplasmatota archaeon]